MVPYRTMDAVDAVLHQTPGPHNTTRTESYTIQETTIYHHQAVTAREIDEMEVINKVNKVKGIQDEVETLTEKPRFLEVEAETENLEFSEVEAEALTKESDDFTSTTERGLKNQDPEGRDDTSIFS